MRGDKSLRSLHQLTKPVAAEMWIGSPIKSGMTGAREGALKARSKPVHLFSGFAALTLLSGFRIGVRLRLTCPESPTGGPTREKPR